MSFYRNSFRSVLKAYLSILCLPFTLIKSASVNEPLPCDEYRRNSLLFPRHRDPSREEEDASSSLVTHILRTRSLSSRWCQDSDAADAGRETHLSSSSSIIPGGQHFLRETNEVADSVNDERKTKTTIGAGDRFMNIRFYSTLHFSISFKLVFGLLF